jgi:hypothetical protein
VRALCVSVLTLTVADPRAADDWRPCPDGYVSKKARAPSLPRAAHSRPRQTVVKGSAIEGRGLFAKAPIMWVLPIALAAACLTWTGGRTGRGRSFRATSASRSARARRLFAPAER